MNVAPDESTRDESMINCFQAIGQVVHLLQDMAVPAHVRNDFSQGHTMVRIEKEWPSKWFGNGFEFYVKRNNRAPWFESAIKENFTDPFLTQFWDTDQLNASYNGIGMDTLGLAEYTNFNFLSEYTMFTQNFPFPKAEHCEVILDYVPEGIPDLDRQYLSSTNGHPGEQINHLAVISYLESFRKEYFPNVSSRQLPVFLDETCYADYAAKLIPRAVGYSASLLDYFFRGNMKLAADGEGCYIVNPMDEDIQGRFELYYDNVNDERVPVNNVDSYPWQDAVNPTEEDIFNMTAAYMSVAAGGQSNPLELFAIPQDAKVPGEFMLVMKGRMGQETINAVAASKITIPLIELSLPTEKVYAITDRHPYYADTSDPRYVNDPAHLGFNKIVINAKNISQAGNMTGGSVALQVKYRLGQSNQFTYPPGATSNDTFYRIVAGKEGVSLPSGVSTRLEFNLPTELPLWATDVHLFLIYNGTVGDKSNALCLGYKDISEPTPVDITNRMDKICLYNKLYDAGSAGAIEAGDTDGDGVADRDVYAHALRDLALRIGGTTYTTPYLDAGATARPVLALCDYARSGVIDVSGRVTKVQDADPFSHSNINYYSSIYLTGIKNQMVYYNSFPTCSTSPCWIRHVPWFKPYNGFYSWGGFISINTPYPSGSVCSYTD
ncbi:MAG: hypothetical protein AB1724_10800 [Thermodesulfobacteriota bacterium]